MHILLILYQNTFLLIILLIFFFFLLNGVFVQSGIATYTQVSQHVFHRFLFQVFAKLKSNAVS